MFVMRSFLHLFGRQDNIFFNYLLENDTIIRDMLKINYPEVNMLIILINKVFV